MFLKDLEDFVFIIIAARSRMNLNQVWRILHEKDKRVTKKRVLSILDKLFREKKIKRITIFTEIYCGNREQKIEYEAIIQKP